MRYYLTPIIVSYGTMIEVGSAIENGLNHGLKSVAIVVNRSSGSKDVLKHVCISLVAYKMYK